MPQKDYVDTLLLLALPASGKSEVRRYLMNIERDNRVAKFHLNDTVQLDDYPYVEFMREVDDELAKLGEDGRFFEGTDGRFLHSADWGTLLHLVNEDYAVMMNPALPTPKPDALHLFDRIDAARAKVGAPPAFSAMNDGLRSKLADALTAKTKWVVDELFSRRPESMEGKTLVIEFARGGPQGSKMPLSAPYGYGWNLSQLSDEILQRAAVLYVWVEPEESRRKNRARAVPGATNTVIFHAAPESVMINDYGCDDMDYLLSSSPQPDTIQINKGEKSFLLPVGRFDNRVDRTTFVRDEPSTWDKAMVEALDAGLADGLGKMWSAYTKLHG